MSESEEGCLTSENQKFQLTRDQRERLERTPLYQPGDGIPAEEALRRAKARTTAWKKAHLQGKKSA